jgi:hypothetical protein
MYPDYNNKEHRDCIRSNLSNCGSGVIDEACEMIDALEAKVRELEATIAACKEAGKQEISRRWRYKLMTPPVPQEHKPGDYPALSEDYEVNIADIGFAEKIFMLSCPDLDARIQQLEATLAACRKERDELANASKRIIEASYISVADWHGKETQKVHSALASEAAEKARRE